MALRPFLPQGPSDSNPGTAAQGPGYPARFGQNIHPTPGRASGKTPEPVLLRPLTQFPGDIAIPAGTTVNVPVQTLLGSSCVGFLIQNVTANVSVNINGGGYRTVTQNMSADGCTIWTLAVNG